MVTRFCSLAVDCRLHAFSMPNFAYMPRSVYNGEKWQAHRSPNEPVQDREETLHFITSHLAWSVSNHFGNGWGGTGSGNGNWKDERMEWMDGWNGW
jgi:hypothetical protein